MFPGVLWASLGKMRSKEVQLEAMGSSNCEQEAVSLKREGKKGP